MTIRARLTIWYGLTLMLLVGIAGVVVWWQVQVSLQESLAQELAVRATDVATSLADDEDLAVVTAPVGPGIFTLLSDATGRRIVASPNTPAGLPELPLGRSQARLGEDDATYAFYSMELPDGRLLVTGSSLAAVGRRAERVPELLVTIGGLCALASLAGGWWLAGRALGPIRRLTAEADAIGPHDLTRRLPSFRQQDEVGHLAETLNRLLARVESGVLRERAFIAGAAHDLRTPIASLRMRLDALVQGGTEDRAGSAAVEDARQDVINLGQLADDLLGLAEAQTPGPADVAGDEVLPLLVSRAEQEVEWLAHERGVHIAETVDEVMVRVSAVRFHQALVNVLANAVRHGPSDGTVCLKARVVRGPRPDRGDVGRSELRVEVADEGAGIPPEARDDLFVPFGLRRRGAQSHGLGLATAAAAVRSQGGEIGYRDGDGGGSVFWFSLPLPPEGDGARRPTE